jgi:hypothetical protein
MECVGGSLKSNGVQTVSSRRVKGKRMMGQLNKKNEEQMWRNSGEGGQRGITYHGRLHVESLDQR